MLYVAHAYEASAVLQTLALPSFLPTGPCLAMIRQSTIEFLSLATDNATSSASVELLDTVKKVTINARILAAQPITDPSLTGAAKQSLLILTDHYQPRLINVAASTNPGNGELVIETTATLALDEVARSPTESALGIWSEPFLSGTPSFGQRIALMHVYKGVARVVPLSGSLASSRSQDVGDQDEFMQDVSTNPTLSRGVQFSQSFSIRLPHPNLLSCAVLSPSSQDSVPAIALLSQSSIPSEIPGLGELCLPVLSFHSVHVADQELSPLPWGTPRKPPRRSDDTGNDDKRFQPQDSAAATQISRDLKTAKKDDKEATRKKHGPAAMGAKLTPQDLQNREEKLAKSGLAQCHVPLPTADATGAHFVHALPAHVGGGVLIFSENSILYVPPPSNPPASTIHGKDTGTTASERLDAKGKRRKASEGSIVETCRRSSGVSQVKPAPIKAPAAATATTLPSSNENGKRRRSSVNLSSTGADSPDKSADSSPSRPRLLRVSLPHPVQVVSVVDMADADADAFSVLFACNSGALNVLRLGMPDHSQHVASQLPQPRSLRVEALGTTSQPAGPQALSYLGQGLVCVGSATGDNCLYRIIGQNASQKMPASSSEQVLTPPSSPTQSRSMLSHAASSSRDHSELSTGGSLVNLETWQNLGPVVDFVVDDGAGGDPTYASGAQARIVTCSGLGPTGSVREARSGASVRDIASLPIPNAEQIWSVDAGVDDASKLTIGLLVSFATSTAYLHFNADGDLTDATDQLVAAGANVSLPTIAATTVLFHDRSPQLLRVDRTGASLFSVQDASISILDQWRPPNELEVTSASVNSVGQAILALSDKSLLYLTDEDGALIERNKKMLEDEVSCVDISPLIAGKAAQLVACGFWGRDVFDFYNLPDLEVVPRGFAAEFSSVPRSILLHRFESSQPEKASDAEFEFWGFNPNPLDAYLLIGLGDGTLVSFRLGGIVADGNAYVPVSLYDAKTITLGTQALKLDAIKTSTGARVVAISGSRPTLVYHDSKRFSYSALKYKDPRSVATVCAGPGRVFAVVVLTDSLELTSISALGQRDIRTFSLGLNQPLAIAQWADRKVFAVCTWTFLPRGSASKQEGSRGAVRILDHTTFELLDEIRLEPDERPNCITLLDLPGHKMLVVGTGYVSKQSSETVRGRLVAFDVSTGSSRTKEERGRLRQLFECSENGNVYQVQSTRYHLCAAVNSEIKTYSITNCKDMSDKRPSGGPRRPYEVRQEGSWACSFIACNLSAIEPDRLVVGDALRSMNVLNVDRYTGRLTEIARDCDPSWTSATELLDSETQTYIGADISFNLYTTQRMPMSEEVRTSIRRARERETERSVSLAYPRTLRDTDDCYAHVMQRKAVWHYGDMINKFRQSEFWVVRLVPRHPIPSHPILSNLTLTLIFSFARRLISTASLVSDPGPDAAVWPKLVFCTAAGAIGVIAHVRDDEAQILAKVERNILSLIESPTEAASAGVIGNIAHSDWRTLRTDHRVQAPAGFLDADVLQMFLDGRLDHNQRYRVVHGPNSEAEALGVRSEVVEQLIEKLSQVC